MTIKFTKEDIAKHAHICPVCGCRCFNVSAHVVQDWKVNEYGDFIELLDDSAEVTHFPDDEDIWDCDNCTASEQGQRINTQFWARILHDEKTKKDAVSLLLAFGYKEYEATNIANAWLAYHCRNLIEAACNCGILSFDGNGNIAVYHTADDDGHPEGWYLISVENAAEDLAEKPDDMAMLENTIKERYEAKGVFTCADKHFVKEGEIVVNSFIEEKRCSWNETKKKPVADCAIFIAAAKSAGIENCQRCAFRCYEDGNLYYISARGVQEYSGALMSATTSVHKSDND